MTVPDRAYVEANLQLVRPECDLPESPDDDAEVRIGRGLKYPKDKGYAKILATLGYDPNYAGMLAAWIVEEGRVRALTSKLRTEFSGALRKLADPRIEADAFLANSMLVLNNMGGTNLVKGLFGELPPFEGLMFVRALRICLAGELSERTEVTRIAGAIWRRVFVSRGPKLSHASAAHEYFLESLAVFVPGAFTRSPDDGDFTDRLTQATREEFDDPDFSPESARRRLRAKSRSIVQP